MPVYLFKQNNPVFKPLKKKFHIVIQLIFSSLFIATSNATPRTNLPIPQTVISSIVNQTFAITNHNAKPTSSDIALRTEQINQYLLSVGGNNWYKNYMDKMGFPTRGEAYVAETEGVTDNKLGYYYIHRPLISGDNLLAFTCLPEPKTPSPTMDAFCGLANYGAYKLTNEQRYYDTFLKWADLFVNIEKNGRWEWPMDIPARGIKSPWISGLTQSVGVSLLLRAYQSTNDKKYLNLATKAFKWIELPVKKGGITIETEKGAWYEEYPNLKEPSHVLNGHMWALFGLWDYYRVTGDPTAKKMFERGIEVIKANIENYDIGYWVVYASTNRVDCIEGNYMGFVIQQIKVLYAITGDDFFNKYSRKWDNYQKNDAFFVHMVVENFLKSDFLPKDLPQLS